MIMYSLPMVFSVLAASQLQSSILGMGMVVLVCTTDKMNC